MKNWLTSIYGVLFVAAGVLAKSATGTLQQVAEIVSLTFGGLGFHAAKDKAN